MLLSVGHTWADIQDYTVSQIRHFSRAAKRFHERSAALQLQVTAVGARGDEKTFENTMSTLLRGR